MVGTWHFRMLDSDLSRADQTAASPRHFLYVVNPRGEFLQHPDAGKIFDLKSRKGATVQDSEAEIRKLRQEFEDFMKPKSTTEEKMTEEENINREQGQTLEDVPLETLHSWFGFSDVLPEEILRVLDWKTQEEDQRKKRSEFKAKLFALLHEHPEYRTGMPTRDIPRFKIRCLSHRKQDVLMFQEEIDGLLEEVGVTGKIPWKTPVELKTFAVHQVRMPYGGMQKGLYVDLAVAVAEEELQADVLEEVWQIRMMALAGFGGAAAVLAVLFSLMITRPLHKIITSTKRLGRGRFRCGLAGERSGRDRRTGPLLPQHGGPDPRAEPEARRRTGKSSRR